MELYWRINHLKKYLYEAHSNKKYNYSKGSGSIEWKSDAGSYSVIFARRIDSGRMPKMQ
jgi:hypothetical protein